MKEAGQGELWDEVMEEMKRLQDAENKTK